jgi:hypothetical protein
VTTCVHTSDGCLGGEHVVDSGEAGDSAGWPPRVVQRRQTGNTAVHVGLLNTVCLKRARTRCREGLQPTFAGYTCNAVRLTCDIPGRTRTHYSRSAGQCIIIIYRAAHPREGDAVGTRGVPPRGGAKQGSELCEDLMNGWNMGDL